MITHDGCRWNHFSLFFVYPYDCVAFKFTPNFCISIYFILFYIIYVIRHFYYLVGFVIVLFFILFLFLFIHFYQRGWLACLATVAQIPHTTHSIGSLIVASSPSLYDPHRSSFVCLWTVEAEKVEYFIATHGLSTIVSEFNKSFAFMEAKSFLNI